MARGLFAQGTSYNGRQRGTCSVPDLFDMYRLERLDACLDVPAASMLPLLSLVLRVACLLLVRVLLLLSCRQGFGCDCCLTQWHDDGMV